MDRQVTRHCSNAGEKHTGSNESPKCVQARRIALELRLDRDDRHRWFIHETDEDTEVSGATPEQAWADAAQVWRGPAWNFQKVSDTVAMIDADDGPTYTLTDIEHAAWYSDDQRKHDEIHARLRATLPAGTEIQDAAGIVVDTTEGAAHA